MKALNIVQKTYFKGGIVIIQQPTKPGS